MKSKKVTEINEIIDPANASGKKTKSYYIFNEFDCLSLSGCVLGIKKDGCSCFVCLVRIVVNF